MNSFNESQFQELLSRLCDGEISAQEMDKLETLLAGNDDAQRKYSEYTKLHLALQHRLRDEQSSDDTESKIPNLSTANASVRCLAKEGGKLSPPFKYSLRKVLVGLAAALLPIAAIAWWWSNLAEPEFTVRIVQKVDCEWGDGHWGTPHLANLEPGREISLERGLMFLEFGNGAEVVLEGPAKFRIVDNSCGELILGKLTAEVPEQGHGFTVRIPEGEVVDLGTRFGVSVDEQGTSETHVFEGLVLLRTDRVPAGLTQQQWELASGKATRWSPSSNELSQLATARSAMFVHNARHVVENVNPELLSIQVPSDSDLVLWLDASKNLQLDDGNKVISWGDLCLADNREEDNAWQVDAELRPRWAPKANGRPAVRFDGDSYLVTTPFETTGDVTVFCVTSPNAKKLSEKRAGYLIDFGGPPSLTLDWSRRQRLRGAVLRNRRGQPELLSGLAETSPALTKDPIVIAYQCSYAANHSALYCNGELASEADAPFSPAVTSSKYLGSSDAAENYFAGDVHELLIFNSSLTQEQLLNVSQSLMKKHGLSNPSPEPRVLSGLRAKESS